MMKVLGLLWAYEERLRRLAMQLLPWAVLCAEQSLYFVNRNDNGKVTHNVKRCSRGEGALHGCLHTKQED